MTTAITPQIAPPSKWDIIPLHTSDRATFKSCRRRWHWSSPAQSNLIPKISVYGVYEPFWLGNGIHYALQHYYDPRLKEDPVVAFETWFDLQWNGGIIAEHELTEFDDRNPYQGEDGHWRVSGLRDVLPFVDEDKWFGLKELGEGMMRFYKEYAEREDDFTVVNTEHLFSVPILNPATGEPLYMVDTRVSHEKGYTPPNMDEGNEYGPLMKELSDGTLVKQVHARGRMDLIVQSNKTGNFVLIDHKTVGKALDDNYFQHLALDEQVTTYSWAAEQEAKLYGLPYTHIAGIVYQAIRKAYPVPPTILKGGTPSLNKQTESTTAQLFAKSIKELGLEKVFELDAKMQGYYTYLVDMGDKQFVWRESVTRNEAQKENAGYRIYLEAMDMLDSPRIYPTPSKDFTCLRCSFRTPCIALESGHDWEGMIADNYESNYDR